MTDDDLVKQLRDYTCDCGAANPKHLTWEAADRIEELEAALFSIYVAPNDQPFIKSKIESVLDVNECRQKWGQKKDEQTP